MTFTLRCFHNFIQYQVKNGNNQSTWRYSLFFRISHMFSLLIGKLFYCLRKLPIVNLANTTSLVIQQLVLPVPLDLDVRIYCTATAHISRPAIWPSPFQIWRQRSVTVWNCATRKASPTWLCLQSGVESTRVFPFYFSLLQPSFIILRIPETDL